MRNREMRDKDASNGIPRQWRWWKYASLNCISKARVDENAGSGRLQQQNSKMRKDKNKIRDEEIKKKSHRELLYGWVCFSAYVCESVFISICWSVEWSLYQSIKFSCAVRVDSIRVVLCCVVYHRNYDSVSFVPCSHSISALFSYFFFIISRRAHIFATAFAFVNT